MVKRGWWGKAGREAQRLWGAEEGSATLPALATGPLRIDCLRIELLPAPLAGLEADLVPSWHTHFKAWPTFNSIVDYLTTMLALRGAAGAGVQAHRGDGAREGLLVPRSSFPLSVKQRHVQQRQTQQHQKQRCRADSGSGGGGGAGNGGAPVSLAALAALARSDPDAVEWSCATVVENRWECEAGWLHASPCCTPLTLTLTLTAPQRTAPHRREASADGSLRTLLLSVEDVRTMLEGRRRRGRVANVQLAERWVDSYRVPGQFVALRYCPTAAETSTTITDGGSSSSSNGSSTSSTEECAVDGGLRTAARLQCLASTPSEARRDSALLDASLVELLVSRTGAQGGGGRVMCGRVEAGG